jgi:hypothetical protein
MTLPVRLPLRSTPFPIIANLTTDRGTALGVEAGGVCDLCRKLIAAGVDPATPLHAYRGIVLCLRIRTIGEAAKLTVVERERGNGPRFERWKPRLLDPAWKARRHAATQAQDAISAPILPEGPPAENNAPTAEVLHGESDDDVIERIEQQQLELHDPGEPEPDGEWGQP